MKHTYNFSVLNKNNTINHNYIYSPPFCRFLRFWLCFFTFKNLKKSWTWFGIYWATIFFRPCYPLNLILINFKIYTQNNLYFAQNVSIQISCYRHKKNLEYIVRKWKNTLRFLTQCFCCWHIAGGIFHYFNRPHP